MSELQIFNNEEFGKEGHLLSPMERSFTARVILLAHWVMRAQMMLLQHIVRGR